VPLNIIFNTSFLLGRTEMEEATTNGVEPDREGKKLPLEEGQI